jgi:hypothetical protein
MENTPVVDEVVVPKKNFLFEVTTVSKVLAAILFIILPFVSFWIGLQFNSKAPQNIEVSTYSQTPEKSTFEIEKPVIAEANPIATNSTSSTIVFPIIAFEREGLLTSDERKLLTEKFIEPYVDYYQMSEDNILVTTVIEIPEETGKPYIIRNVQSDGNAGGFMFGSKGDDYNYWAPGCFVECEFSNEYANKHPEVIEQYRKNIAP